MFNAFNIVAYNVVWFLSIHGAGNLHPLVGPASAIAFAIVHFITISKRLVQLRLMGLVLTGTLVETYIHSNFVYSFTQPHAVAPLIPIWLILIWACFSCTLRYSLSTLLRHNALAFISGSIAGPLSYYGAQAIGAIVIIHTLTSYIILGVSWGLMMVFFRQLINHPLLK